MKLKQIAFAALVTVGASSAFAANPTTFTELAVNHGYQLVDSFGDYVITPSEIVGTNTSPAGTFAAFCIEPGIPYGTPLTGMSFAIDVPLSEQLSRLFTGAHWMSWDSANDGVTTMKQITALQLGIWEIITDGVASPMNFSAGGFRVVSTFAGDPTAADYQALAQSWYDNGNTSMAGSIYRIADDYPAGSTRNDRQDLVIAVPEPSTYALMIAGLAAMGFVSRRRSTKA